MNLEGKGEILEEIGRLIHDQLDGNVEGAFLYCEATEDSASGYLLEEAGDRMIYHLADFEIVKAVMALVSLDPRRKRWQAMRYSMKDGRFTAEFDFPKDIDREELDTDRISRVLRAWAGNRPLDNTLAKEKVGHLFDHDVLYPDG